MRYSWHAGTPGPHGEPAHRDFGRDLRDDPESEREDREDGCEDRVRERFSPRTASSSSAFDIRDRPSTPSRLARS